MAKQKLLWLLVLILAVMHQDFWWWDNESLIFGFMPVGLGYHVLYSILAAGVWGLAIIWAWPVELEALADETPSVPAGSSKEEDSLSGHDAESE